MAPATTEDDVRFILQAFSTVQIVMNFTEVAPAVGMKQSGHASAKFQTIVKKYGFEYDRPKGILTAIDGAVASATTTPKKTPAKPKKASAKKPSAKKRKLEAVEEGNEDDDEEPKVEDDEANGVNGETNGVKSDDDEA